MVARGTMRCCRCGGALTDQNSWTMPADFTSQRVPYCLACQQRYYNWLSPLVGWQEAIFICCAAFNVPFVKKALTESQLHKEGRGAWGGYLSVMRQRYSWGNNSGRASFQDGTMDFRTVFFDEEEEEEAQTQEPERLPREIWGDGPQDKPYTEGEYEEMERQYAALADGRFEMSEQTRLAIINICKMEILKNRYLESGEIKAAKDLSAMIKTEKEGEQLRKKDEIAANTTRLDDIVLAVQRAGLDIMDPEELLTALANHSYRPVPSYGYTYDAAEKMLLFIRNATAWNEGREEVASLPPEYSFADDPNHEFAPEQDEKEKRMYRELGIFYNGKYGIQPDGDQTVIRKAEKPKKRAKRTRVSALTDMVENEGSDVLGITEKDIAAGENNAEETNGD